MKLYDAAALPLNAEPPSQECLTAENTGCEGFVFFGVHKKDNHHVLCPRGTPDEFALLDTQCSNRLRAIEGLESVRFDAIIEAAVFKKRKKGKRSKPTPFSLSVNVYGPPSTADEVGRKLSAASGFLQHPKALSQSVDYRNPQLLQFSDDPTPTATRRSFLQ
ncbi:hypothetical protein CTA2_2879 [Colletotrichum tanaceti]|uniref:Uncharacterized protein n=1 Tax=Colletotrichum tanaceti TaxID=1306861 RepID=A0A4U6XL70_9PEZI|nr:hypothetical protein CTA2_2879 [Colletotrichum tanaceti]TKW56388.1 hypothetical protein CTA1_7226 [Colletotrichum tanaceti]